MSTVLLLQADWLLRLLVKDWNGGGDAVAADWASASVLVATACVALMASGKWLLKKSAPNPFKLTWKWSKTLLFILGGLAPVAVIMLSAWYLSINFHDYAALFSGIVFAWIIYALGMVLVHAATQWRRDLF